MKKSLKWNIAQNAEAQWWQNYLKGKDVTAYHNWKKNYWQNILNSIANVCSVNPGMEILDAGCGPAGIFMNLTQCNVDAIDPLLENYNSALPHFKKSDYPYVTFYNTPMEQYSTDKQYDIVFCMNAINHVIDMEYSYSLLGKWVKPGGKLVITIDAHNFSFFKYLFRLIPGDILHPHQYDLKEYAGFITRNGCKILMQEKLKSEFFFNHYLQVAEKM
ncbi:MAG TPA: methyltransferase domain-containing protein [Chitinophagales bacterium]|nr:methyltransferase domain-containing protein [Chitinophagales bacterium]